MKKKDSGDTDRKGVKNGNMGEPGGGEGDVRKRECIRVRMGYPIRYARSYFCGTYVDDRRGLREISG